MPEFPLMRDTCLVTAIRDWEGERLIIMGHHDGFFQVPPDKPELMERIRQAFETRQDVSFTFDRNLFIQSID